MRSGSVEPTSGSDEDLEPIGVSGQQRLPPDRSRVGGRRWMVAIALAVLVVGALAWNAIVTRSQLDDVRDRLRHLESTVPRTRTTRVCFPSPVRGSVVFDVAHHGVTGSLRGLPASSYVEIQLDGRQAISGRSDAAGVMVMDAPWFARNGPTLAGLFYGASHTDAKLFVRGSVATCPGFK